MSRERRVVLLGGSGAALSAARSLHAWGVHVTVLGAQSDPVRVSRSCDEFVDLGRGKDVQDRWLDWLVLEEQAGGVILACSDDGLELLATKRDKLVSSGYRLGESRDDVVRAMLDKERTYELARQHGIACPKTVSIRSDEDIDEALNTVPFPCAVKPLHAHLFAQHFNAKLFVASNKGELLDLLQLTRSLDLDVMVTEIIPGTDDAFVSYYSYIDAEGVPLFHFTKRKIRGYPTRYGNWCYQVTCWDEGAASLGLHFFQTVGLLGVGNVEFKRDARDGRLKLIECNHRFTASNEILRTAGVDVARLAFARASGDDFTVGDFQEGLYLWHPAEDFVALLAYLRTGEWSVGRWVASLMHRQHFPVFSLHDPLPSLVTWISLPKRFRTWFARRTAEHSSSHVATPQRYR